MVDAIETNLSQRKQSMKFYLFMRTLSEIDDILSYDFIQKMESFFIIKLDKMNAPQITTIFKALYQTEYNSEIIWHLLVSKFESAVKWRKYHSHLWEALDCYLILTKVRALDAQ